MNSIQAASSGKGFPLAAPPRKLRAAFPAS